MAVFFDTWGWVALVHRGDAHHPAVKRWYGSFLQHQGVIATSEVVLAETFQLLTGRCDAHGVLGFAEVLQAALPDGDVSVYVVSTDILEVSLALFRQLNAKSERRHKHRERMISLVDCTSMTLMRAAGVTEILTGDRHFLDVGMGIGLVALD